MYHHEGLQDSQSPKALKVSLLRDLKGITTTCSMGQAASCWVLVFVTQLQEPTMTSQATQSNQDSFLRVPSVLERMGVSRSYWWKGVKDGKFPQGTKLSARVTVWRASEIDALIASLGK